MSADSSSPWTAPRSHRHTLKRECIERHREREPYRRRAHQRAEVHRLAACRRDNVMPIPESNASWGCGPIERFRSQGDGGGGIRIGRGGLRGALETARRT